jgi:16S rRNA C967 or C1407 C5-methylase (RsmB/RsmF family)
MTPNKPGTFEAVLEVLDTGPALKLLPHVHGCDGFYAAVLQRSAEKASEGPRPVEVDPV